MPSFFLLRHVSNQPSSTNRYNAFLLYCFSHHLGGVGRTKQDNHPLRCTCYASYHATTFFVAVLPSLLFAEKWRKNRYLSSNSHNTMGFSDFDFHQVAYHGMHCTFKSIYNVVSQFQPLFHRSSFVVIEENFSTNIRSTLAYTHATSPTDWFSSVGHGFGTKMAAA